LLAGVVAATVLTGVSTLATCSSVGASGNSSNGSADNNSSSSSKDNTRPQIASSCDREDTIQQYVSELLADTDFWSRTITSSVLMGNTQAISFIFRDLTSWIIDEFESSLQLAAPPTLFGHTVARRVTHVPLHHAGVGLPWPTCECVADALLNDSRFQSHSRVVAILTHDIERTLISNIVRFLSYILVDVSRSSGAELAGLRLRWESDALEAALHGQEEQLAESVRDALRRIDFQAINEAAEMAARDPSSSGGSAVLPFEVYLCRTFFVAALIVFHCLGGIGCVSCGGCRLHMGLAPLELKCAAAVDPGAPPCEAD
jgi:hypothetical protein